MRKFFHNTSTWSCVFVCVQRCPWTAAWQVAVIAPADFEKAGPTNSLSLQLQVSRATAVRSIHKSIAQELYLGTSN